MSDNKIVYSNEGIKILVNDQGTGNEVSKLKGVIDQTEYEYLEVSGNVEFLNDVNIDGDIKAGNIELLPTSTKRVLFNNVGKISSSADFSWDFDTNILNVNGSVQATSFTGSLKGIATTASVLQNSRTIAATGDLSWQVSFDGSNNASSAATLSDSGVTAGTYNNSSTQITPFTVDAKGRITGTGTSVTITPSFSSIINKPTTLSGYGITDPVVTAAGSGGQIQFHDGQSPAGLAASNDLSWDNTNSRLGINTNTPAAPLQFGTNAQTGFSQHSYYQIILHYNSTANNCYGLGIESGNMKFNSNGGYKFYVQGTEKIALSNSGNITATGFIGDGSQLTGITTSNLSGITSVSNGGTGFSSFSNGQFLVGNSSGTLSKHVFIAGNGIAINVGTSDTKISADLTKIATLDTSQTFTSQKTFSSSPVFNAAGIFNQGIYAYGTSTFNGDIEVQSTFYVDESLNRVGIKDSTPSYPLDVNGATRINSYLIVGNSSVSTTGIRPASNNYFNIGNSTYKWNDIWATNSTINTSDERRKDLIEDIPHGVELLNNLRPVQYKWKDYTQTNDDGTQIDKKYTRKHFGIIAQELKATLEEKNISTNDFAPYVYDSDSDSYAVRYGEFVPILIKSVQELSKENNDLKTRLEILETLVASLIN